MTGRRFFDAARSRRMLACRLGLFLLLTLAGPGLQAAASGKVRTVEHLHSALRDDTLVLSVFTKGDQVRLYFTNEEQRVMFKADWDRSRVRVAGFGSHLATLKLDATPPPLPGPKDKWHRVKALDFEAWRNFVDEALDRLAPAKAGQGIYFQFALGDAVLFRDHAGKARATPFASRPPGLTIIRRFSRIEATAAIAGAVEADLRAEFPQEKVFALVPSREDRRPCVVLLDLTERRVVMMLAPRAGEDPRGGIHIGGKISALFGFILIDHGWAILKNPVSSVGRLLNQVTQWTSSLFNSNLRARATTIPSVTNTPGMDLAAWEQWLDRHVGARRERGSLKLLIDGEQFFPVFEDRLAKATDSVDIHICIFDRDDIGAQVADRLKDCAEKIPVRVIYDHTSTLASGNTPPGTPMPDDFIQPESIWKYLHSESWVKVRPFLNPFMKSDHSKVLIVDGRYAYVGGMNFGREYRYEWHDLMAEIEGPVVASLAREFDIDWAHAGPLGDFAYAGEVIFGKQPKVTLTNRADFIDLRRLYTSTGSREIRKAELECIRRARSHIYIENPYLYDRSVIVALVKARLRGVDVRVILPSENDLSGGLSSNLVTANYLLKHGVRVYFYPGMTHVKAMVADGWVCFGSANFNTLSLRMNQEVDLATSDPGCAARFRQTLFMTDFERSYELKEPASVDWTDHLAGSILNMF